MQIRFFVLCLPTSAVAERVFSLLNNSMSSQQGNSLEDYIAASVMVHYNSSQRNSITVL